ncbi:MAG: electron transport complex subunit RsxC [Gammaproteobacteria bacterium]|nr:electron transport complex subunit RsxC [Gammaproteobacteria bacterium]MBU1656012.1 electron transport complex subunit RsxC [Gammaproteobacteria bacterium]MBU1962220.1 electron transport complex subunit RsxC [Gammaproteobacteria bacterium]
MNLAQLLGMASFRHGIHPPDHKAETASRPIRRMPFPPRLVLPLAQHIGKPALPLVQKGQEVVRGQPIAAADGYVSSPIHAPATGRVRGIELMPSARGPKEPAILLDVYESATQEVLWGSPRKMGELTPEEIVQAVWDSGMVGLGGAAFPSHVKLAPPKGLEVDVLVVNGCECEPYLTCDYRMMLEWTDDLVRGTRYAMLALGVKKAVIGIEDNKMDAVRRISDRISAGSGISVKAVETKYPQGAEKMLIKSALGREVPAGGLPAQIGVVVNNVGTLAMLGRLLPRGEGLIERVITVTGPGVERPGNYLVPIGATVGFVLKQAGLKDVRAEVILGGPMMGSSVPSFDTPIIKGTSGVLVLNEPAIGAEDQRIWPCIKCGRCLSACPMHLNPSMLGLLAAKREFDTMAEKYHLFDCFECGCCSYTCPSNIPLVQYFRIAKSIQREKAA